MTRRQRQLCAVSDSSSVAAERGDSTVSLTRSRDSGPLMPPLLLDVCVQLFKERKLTYAGAGAIAAGELVAAGCVIFFTLGWVIYCVESEQTTEQQGASKR